MERPTEFSFKEWRPSPRRLVLLALIAAASILYSPLERRVAAAVLLNEMQHEDKSRPPAVGEPITNLRLRGKPVPAFSYGPTPDRARRIIVLAHGIHHKGIREPRLIRFARHLAERGCHVITPELAELADYQVSFQGVEVLKAAVEFASGRDERRIGLIGFSFAGGLSMLAATDREIASRLTYVASVGGYHDLERSLRFLATNRVQTPDGIESRKAHEYGLLVLLYGNIGRLALGDDRDTFQRALKAWLMEDRATARREATQLATERARTLFQRIEKQKLTELSEQILPIVDARSTDLAKLSPRDRLSRIETQVLFLHGLGDNVVPPEETEFALSELEASSHNNYDALVTPLLRHVGVGQRPDSLEKLKLVHLIAQFL